MQSFKRRNWFPEPKFQLRYLSLLLGASIVQVMITGGILTHFIRENYTLLVHYAALEPEVADMLHGELKMLILIVGGTFFVFLMGTAAIGVVFSHRIAGSVYAIKRTINAIRNGRNEKLHLREKDEFRELVESFNLMVDELREGKLSKRVG